MSTTTAEVRERPILFSTPMVRGILDGHKTQTRRVVKPQPNPEWSSISVGPYHPIKVDRRGEEYPGPETYGACCDGQDWPCPFGRPGDRLWVKETYSTEDEYYIYRADLPDWSHLPDLKWKSGRFMPHVASRITLEIERISFQPLQRIPCEDYEAEGFHGRGGPDSFRELWDKLNGKTFPWKSNPFVWAISFKLLSPPRPCRAAPRRGR